MATQPFTNLDFNAVKNNLKSYLKSQDQFKDYDFEGSNINVLLDILAYNTFQNNFYTNMALSEMFLDSAQLRDSVASHAKELNYTPRSRRSAVAAIDIEFFPTDSPSTITIPARTTFNARCGTKIFTFSNPDPRVIKPINGRYVASAVDVYEGKYVEEFFEVVGQDQRFIISNDDIDTTSLRVFVSENTESVSETEYRLKTNIYDVDSNDNVYYIQPYTDSTYEVIFGQNVFGKKPENGNVIRVLYRRTVGEEANGINSITLADAINAYSTNITLLASSQGGDERENIESIRYFAPKSIQIQERAVTEKDYAILLQNQFPEIRSVSVFGGERLSPPQYGRVVLSVYANNTENITEANRTKYINYVADKSPVTIEPIVIPARFMYIDISSDVYYNTNITNASSSAIQEIVSRSIRFFATNNLGEFDRNFRFSRFTSAIDESDSSILSNDTSVRSIITISPQKNQSRFYVLQFSNELQVDKTFSADQISDYVPSVTSTPFIYSGRTSYLQDNGQGRLDVVRIEDGSVSFVQRNVGTVNYKTGDVVIRSITIQDYIGSGINIYAKLKSKNIIAPQDRILRIRDEDININVIGRTQ